MKLDNLNDSSSYSIACFANSLVEPFFPNFKMTFLLFSWGSFHQTTRHITPHIVIVSKENVGEYKVQTWVLCNTLLFFAHYLSTQFGPQLSYNLVLNLSSNFAWMEIWKIRKNFRIEKFFHKSYNSRFWIVWSILLRPNHHILIYFVSSRT